MLPHVVAPHIPSDLRPDDVAPLLIGLDLSTARVCVVGELDREHAHLLLEVVAALIASGHRSISVSTEKVTFCDTGGLRALLGLQRLAARRGSELTFVETGTCVQRLLSVTGLTAVLKAPQTTTSPSGAGTRFRRFYRSSE